MLRRVFPSLSMSCLCLFLSLSGTLSHLSYSTNKSRPPFPKQETRLGSLKRSAFELFGGGNVSE